MFLGERAEFSRLPWPIRAKNHQAAAGLEEVHGVLDVSNVLSTFVGRIGDHGIKASELLSVTKIFTALLLSDMARRCEVRINDPVNAYLPEGIHVGGTPKSLRQILMSLGVVRPLPWLKRSALRHEFLQARPAAVDTMPTDGVCCGRSLILTAEIQRELP
ncbi:MAG: serine hydrolase [Steroidobacteraceae bacterium]|nr:serine hydrolase [Steroidobacteraceae bacterium]